MSDTENGIKALEELFDLGDSDVDVEDVYNEDAGDSTFEDKKSELNELLQEEKEENGETKKASIKDIIMDSISDSQPLVIKELIDEKETEKVIEKTEEEKVEKSNIVVEKTDDDLDFDTSDSFTIEEDEKPVQKSKKAVFTKQEDPEIEVKEEPKEDVKVEEEPEPEKEEVEDAEMAEEKEPEIKIVNKSASHKWRLTHPEAKFNYFYKMKKERIERFLYDGEVPYDRWIEELIKARVDLATLVFDLDHLSSQMQKIQQHQYRVGEIRMRVNTQYNWCKRSLEFLRGKLAQIAYEKPIEKFNGVVYDHLHDVEDYLQQLETLKENAEIVTKNLDKAAEVVSRRVTVVMTEVKMDKKGTRYNPRQDDEEENIGETSISPMKPVDLSDKDVDNDEDDEDDGLDLDQYDTIGAAPKPQKKEPKSGWDLIPTKR